MADIIKVTFGIQDAKAQVGHVLYYTVADPYFLVLGDDYIAQIKGYFQELALRLDPLIMGKITSISISIDCELPVGLKAAALTHSDVEEGAQFKYPEAAASAYVRHTVPTFDHDIFGTGKVVAWDETTELADYTALVFNSSGAPNWDDDYGVITDNRGAVVTLPPTVFKKFKPS